MVVLVQLYSVKSASLLAAYSVQSSDLCCMFPLWMLSTRQCGVNPKFLFLSLVAPLFFCGIFVGWQLWIDGSFSTDQFHCYLVTSSPVAPPPCVGSGRGRRDSALSDPEDAVFEEDHSAKSPRSPPTTQPAKLVPAPAPAGEVVLIHGCDLLLCKVILSWQAVLFPLRPSSNLKQLGSLLFLHIWDTSYSKEFVVAFTGNVMLDTLQNLCLLDLIIRNVTVNVWSRKGLVLCSLKGNETDLYVCSHALACKSFCFRRHNHIIMRFPLFNHHTLRGDDVCMLTHPYPQKPLKKIIVVIYDHQTECPIILNMGTKCQNWCFATRE